MRRTKIVCTIGPSSSGEAKVRALLEAGMDVARLNFSHGDHKVHLENHRTLRHCAQSMGVNLAIMMDLQGPKIRTRSLENGAPVLLEEGKPFTITTEDIVGNKSRVATTYANLPGDVNRGERILLADGTLELKVVAKTDTEVECVVVLGGMLGEKKGINLPGVKVSAPSLTNKDIEDLDFGLKLGVDYVALSFVRTPKDIVEAKERIAASGKSAHVVAKIERPEAIEHFDAILNETDAIMVARGDLGVEVDLQRVPQIQKQLIRACNDKGVPAITATQMLESMMNSPRPTRAEAADVANAIYDGTDAIMLSGESASGKFPIESVKMMNEIARCTDNAISASPPRDIFMRMRESSIRRQGSFSDAIGQAVTRLTQLVSPKRIVCFTKSGHTAVTISRYRPQTPITAMTLTEESRRRCALYWGVDAISGGEVENTDAMIRLVEESLLQRGLVEKNDTIIIVAGTPLGLGGRTNLLKLHRVGELA
jgi:pyruvate kinase